jgi:hypothetical protein
MSLKYVTSIALLLLASPAFSADFYAEVGLAVHRQATTSAPADYLKYDVNYVKNPYANITFGVEFDKHNLSSRWTVQQRIEFFHESSLFNSHDSGVTAGRWLARFDYR